MRMRSMVLRAAGFKRSMFKFKFNDALWLHAHNCQWQPPMAHRSPTRASAVALTTSTAGAAVATRRHEFRLVPGGRAPSGGAHRGASRVVALRRVTSRVAGAAVLPRAAEPSGPATPRSG